jgi:hypothetical protein
MTVQAGPKIQFGGFHDGLRRSSYQVPTVVVPPPTASIKITMTIAATMGRVKCGALINGGNSLALSSTDLGSRR